MYWIQRPKGEDDLSPNPLVRTVCHLGISPQEGCVNNYLSLTVTWQANVPPFSEAYLVVTGSLVCHHLNKLEVRM